MTGAWRRRERAMNLQTPRIEALSVICTGMLLTRKFREGRGRGKSSRECDCGTHTCAARHTNTHTQTHIASAASSGGGFRGKSEKTQLMPRGCVCATRPSMMMMVMTMTPHPSGRSSDRVGRLHSYAIVPDDLRLMFARSETLAKLAPARLLSYVLPH